MNLRLACALALLIFGGSSSAFAACSGPTGAEGDMIYNSTHHMMQFCDDTDWIAMAGTNGGGGTNCASYPLDMDNVDNTYGASEVLTQNGYIFISQDTGNITDVDIYAYSFDGTTLTRRTTHAFTGGVGTRLGKNLAGDGTYIYASDTGSRLYGLSYSNPTLTQLTATPYNASQTIEDVHTQGGYVFLALGTTGVRALSFNGTTFTAIATYDTAGTAHKIAGDGTTLFVADDGIGVVGLTFNGTAFATAGSYTANTAGGIVAGGGYIYASPTDAYQPIYALTHSGSSFTAVGNGLPFPVLAPTFADAQYLYTTNVALNVASFDGSDFTPVASFPATQGGANTAGSDGTYLYTVEGYGTIAAYTKCN